MPRNAAGVYSPPSGTLAVSDTTIDSSDYNNFVNDIGSEITGSLPRDGTAGMTGPLPMGGNKITGLGAPSVSGDAARIDDIFPTGTVLLFQQASAPAGWTKLVTNDNKALRLVSGATGGAAGGTTAFTTVFGVRTLVEANLPPHTHSSGTLTGTTDDPGTHTHGVLNQDTRSDVNTGGGGTVAKTGGAPSNAGGAHTHVVTLTGGATGVGSGSSTALDFAVQYVDVIAASKNAV